MPASYTIRRSVPRNTRRSKPASTPSTCFPSFSITCSWRFLSRVVICLPTQQTSYGNRKRHHHLVAAMPRYANIAETLLVPLITEQGGKEIQHEEHEDILFGPSRRAQ